MKVIRWIVVCSTLTLIGCAAAKPLANPCVDLLASERALAASNTTTAVLIEQHQITDVAKAQQLQANLKDAHTALDAAKAVAKCPPAQ